MAMGTGHTGTGGAGGVCSTHVVYGCNREGAGMAGVRMLQWKRKWVGIKD